MIFFAFLFLVIGLLALWIVVLANGSRTAPGKGLKFKSLFTVPLAISAMLFLFGWFA